MQYIFRIPGNSTNTIGILTRNTMERSYSKFSIVINYIFALNPQKSENLNINKTDSFFYNHNYFIGNFVCAHL